MASDGGVSAALAGAKAALSGAANSSVGSRAGHSSFTPGAAPSYTAARAARKTPPTTPPAAKNLGDELKAKADNVSQYAGATSSE
jgi:hypothetical protein